MKKIGFDVDGVLADFDTAFLDTARDLGIMVPDKSKTEYGWDEFMSRSDVNKTWRKLLNNRWWWTRLPQIPDSEVFDRIQMLCQQHEVFFVTHRMHNVTPASFQTVMWLKDRGIHSPNVVLAKLKGEACKALELDYYIDDKLENAWCAHWLSPDTKVYLLDKPWNKLDRPFGPSGRSVVRIDSVHQYINIIETELNTCGKCGFDAHKNHIC